MVERCVQTMKASLIKTMEVEEDVNLALLTYKTTPLSHSLPSAVELLKIQNSATYTDCANKTPRKLQTDHGPRKTNTGTSVQQENQIATKAQAVSKSCSTA